MKYFTLILAGAMVLALGVPTFAQRTHPSPGGPPSSPGARPSGTGPGSNANSGLGGTHEGGTATHTQMSHASPGDVLSHNTAIAGKIHKLTGQDAQTACDGFKNLGQCVAAAHVAKNLDIPGGFDALKAKVTGNGAVSLGNAIEQLNPQVNATADLLQRDNFDVLLDARVLPARKMTLI
jgi:hypothetical protein